MRTISNKALALTIVIVTSLSMLFSLFFLIQVWRYKRPVTNQLQSSINRASEILLTTNQGLDVIDLAVKNVYTSTIFLDESANTLAQTISSTNQFADSASNFIGSNLINTITNTQSAINSAQTSAVVVDNILKTLSNIPLIGIKYNPDKPLNVALGDVSKSLDPLQGSLQGFERNLKDTQVNMQTFQGQISSLKENIVIIKSNLETTQLVISNYRSELHSMQSSVDNAKVSLPRWITNLAWILTFFIFWMILVQIGLLLNALDNLIGKHETVIINHTE